jgi:hypothetical protein
MPIRSVGAVIRRLTAVNGVWPESGIHLSAVMTLCKAAAMPSQSCRSHSAVFEVGETGTSEDPPSEHYGGTHYQTLSHDTEPERPY